MSGDQAAVTRPAAGSRAKELDPPLRVGRVLLLSPSRGLGGGIERYVETLESSFVALGLPCSRIDLASPGVRSHLRLLAAGRRALRSARQPARLVVAHRALLPVAVKLAREPAAAGLSVVCHGSEAWGNRFHLRRRIELGLMRRRPDVRVVAVSNFTAGALATKCRAVVLHPGLSGGWYRTLVDAGAAASAAGPGIRLVTAFRLSSWRDKGLGQLLTAVAALQRSDVQLLICGAGQPPAELLRLTSRYRWCTVLSGISDSEMACQLAAADLFVLATRTRPGRQSSGEGFGLVLLEAQVAGTPVVAPAHGGSSDAYLEGITGFAPTDETVQALTQLLDRILAEPGCLSRMGQRAAEWSRDQFEPERYAELVARRLLEGADGYGRAAR